jgi:predicted MFS family arabinose efflux permease
MTAVAAATPRFEVTISSRMIFLFAAACGIIAANLYYAQPLIGPISATLGLAPQAAGLIVTMTQIGYGVGLLLIVPLGDLVENRRLIIIVVSFGALALLAAAFSARPLPFLAAMLCVGFGSVAVQILIPFAAHLAPDAARGRVVGNVTMGLMLGVMLSRPISSFVTAFSSWHVVYLGSAFAMVALALVLGWALPVRRPNARLHYGELLLSMAELIRMTPILRRRALYHSCLFGAFSLFWTTTPLLLAGPHFGFTQRGIALFALAGVAGAISAPLAGRVADRDWSRPATALAMLLVACAFLLTHIGRAGSPLSLALLVGAAIMLDFGVQANLVLGYRALFLLGAAYRSRINGIYMASFFTAGALGSAVGAWAYAEGGWSLASWIGFALPIAALLSFVAAEPRRITTARS